MNPHTKSADSEESGEDDYVETMTVEKVKEFQKKLGRVSVSAEAFGKFNPIGNFKPKVVPKTETERDQIKAMLQHSFLFNTLEERELKIVIDAMETQVAQKGDVIIRQYNTGDDLYVVASGRLECKRRAKPTEEDVVLKTYTPGETFGELALLYNCPRAATITALENSVLYQLDRQTFNHIVRDSAIKRRERFESLLENIELLSTMDGYERTKIGDCLRTIRYRSGEVVVKEGDPGNTFFFVESGTASARKGDQKVYDYKENDFFGELALLKDIPRQATIIAESELVLACMDRESFRRMIGPLEDILKRQMSKYEKFNQL